MQRPSSEVNGKANLSATGCSRSPLLDCAAIAHIYFTFINYLKYVKYTNFVFYDKVFERNVPVKPAAA